MVLWLVVPCLYTCAGGGAPVSLVSIGRLPSGVMVRPGSGSGNTPGSQPQQPPLAPYGAICRQVRSYLSAHRYTIPAPAPCGCIPNSLSVLKNHHFLFTFRWTLAARGPTHRTCVLLTILSLQALLYLPVLQDRRLVLCSSCWDVCVSVRGTWC